MNENKRRRCERVLDRLARQVEDHRYVEYRYEMIGRKATDTQIKAARLAALSTLERLERKWGMTANFVGPRPSSEQLLPTPTPKAQDIDETYVRSFDGSDGREDLIRLIRNDAERIGVDPDDEERIAREQLALADERADADREYYRACR